MQSTRPEARSRRKPSRVLGFRLVCVCLFLFFFFFLGGGELGGQFETSPAKFTVNKEKVSWQVPPTVLVFFSGARTQTYPEMGLRALQSS